MRRIRHSPRSPRSWRPTGSTKMISPTRSRPSRRPCRPISRPRFGASTRCTARSSQASRSSNGDSIPSGPVYQTVLKRAGDNRAVEDALRDRLTRVTRHEQAAQAARTIHKTLAESRRRDLEVARVQKRLATIDRSRTRTYSAIGFVQPSSRVVDGRKLHALIGANGSTLAYLDIPPGLDVNSLGARRVGVLLGVVHYNQDLGTRLITVRDLETIESRR